MTSPITSPDKLPLKVMFAPDWRAGNAYQSQLAEALAPHEIEVVYPRLTRAIFPLAKEAKEAGADILHVHWPEAYLAMGHAGSIRCLRFNQDIRKVTGRIPVVYTAHNTVPHNVAIQSGVHKSFRALLNRSSTTFIHSPSSRAVLEKEFAIKNLPITMIPHGDLSVNLRRPFQESLAREVLELSDRPMVIMFGVVEPYKGIEDVIQHWNTEQCGADLVICGRPLSREYGEAIEQIARQKSGVSCRLGWMSDLEVRLWISACKAVIFNYRQILTSGAATLVRSMGCPIILPQRLSTVDLDEPNPRVLRFSELSVDLIPCVQQAIAIGSDYQAASSWREKTSWESVAKATADAYRAAVSEPGKSVTPSVGGND